ncbi:MAG: hypothetical protein HY512_01615 [Candidatus Aenigmarchaeota archaeon]|nr:hypothetical protein [Candidatus Aenigmarchaeota archaeon]
MTIWKPKKELLLGTKWKFAVLILLVAMFALLIKLLVISLSFDPIVPIIIVLLLIILVPVTAFIVELFFTTGHT